MELNQTCWLKFLLDFLGKFLRALAFQILSVGPIPRHFAFIMDGNRRYAKKQKLKPGDGHEAGALSLLAMAKYLYEMGVEYITVYAFSIDNFRRKPEQVQDLMDLLLNKIDDLVKQESVVNAYGIKVRFIGNLKLLSEAVQDAAERLTEATSGNTKATLLICLAYTSTDEIVHAVRESCKDTGDKIDESSGKPMVRLGDVEKHFYMAVAPEPDILIRSSGEMRLSNFLLWQTAYCPLYSPAALWPEIGFLHAIWAILIFQRNYSYLEKKKKQYC